MTHDLPLDEDAVRRLMAGEEGEHVEFKEKCDDRTEIAEYAVGIGNEGGGLLLVGITNKKPRRIVGARERPHDDVEKILKSVLDSTEIRVRCEHVRTGDGIVFVVRIPPRPRGQVLHTKKGKYLMRTGEGLRGMTPAEIARLRADDGLRRDFTADVLDAKWQDVVDPLEMERLRRELRDHERDELARLDDEALLRSLDVLPAKGARRRATRAAVLLVGRVEAVREFVPNHEVKLLRLGRRETQITYTEDLRAPLLAVAQRAREVVEVANAVESFQQGMFRVDVQKFPERAYREAIANALIHRDYQLSGNVAVRVYPSRLEVGSPGGWFGSVNETNILVTESQRRNDLLAAAFQKIGLAERSAVGVRRMYEVMLESGKEPPAYRSTSTSVTAVLHDGSFDREFAALARRMSEQGRPLSVFDLLVLSRLRRQRELTVKEAAVLCQQPPEAARRILDELRNRHLVDRRGEGRGRKYVLGRLAYEGLGLTRDRPRDLGMQERTFEGLLLDELERVGAKGLTNLEVRNWSTYGRAKTTELLQQLCKKGVVAWSGRRGRGSRYWLPKHALRPDG